MKIKRRDYVLSPHTMRGAEHCEAARVYVAKEREAPSHAQWWGIFVHRFIEYAQKYDREYALRYVRRKFPRGVKTCESLDLSALPLGEHEVQFLLDVPGRVAQVGAHDDPDPLLHVKAKCDLYSVHEDVHVVDFKTGERQIDLATSIQLATEAVAAWFDNPGSQQVRISIFNIVKGEFVPTSFLLGKDDLERAYRRVERVHLLTLDTRAEMNDGLAPEFEPGPHCSWCHLRHVCEKAERDE